MEHCHWWLQGRLILQMLLLLFVALVVVWSVCVGVVVAVEEDMLRGEC